MISFFPENGVEFCVAVVHLELRNPTDVKYVSRCVALHGSRNFHLKAF